MIMTDEPPAAQWGRASPAEPEGLPRRTDGRGTHAPPVALADIHKPPLSLPERGGLVFEQADGYSDAAPGPEF